MLTLTDQNFNQEVLNSNLPVLVDFWAPWCGPCQMARPILEGLEGEEGIKGKIKFGELNVEENPETTQKYGIMNLPTVVVFWKGEEVGRRIGFKGKKRYEELIEELK